MRPTLFLLVFMLNSYFHMLFVDAGGCYDIVLQYFQCAKLRMNPVSGTGTFGIVVKKYLPDKKLPNNILDDKFFDTELAEMDVDKAVKLFQTVYNATDSNCKSEFCDCVRSGLADRRARFYQLFANDAMVEQVKRVIVEFNEIHPYTDSSTNETESDSSESFGSLTKFCSQYDFSSERLWQKPETFKCISRLRNSVN